MPIENRIQAAVDEAEQRLHDDIHAAVESLSARIAVLEARVQPAAPEPQAVPAPRRTRAPKQQARPVDDASEDVDA